MPKLSAEAQIRSKKAGTSESSPRYIAESCMNTHSPPNETRPAAGGRSVMLPQGRLLTAVTSITEPMIPLAEDKSLPVAEERSSAAAGIIPKHSRNDGKSCDSKANLTHRPTGGRNAVSEHIGVQSDSGSVRTSVTVLS